MDAVACEKHGTYPGMLSCDHVRLAAQVSGEAVSFDVYGCDMLGDETSVIKHLICAGCAARCGLSPSKLIPEEIWSDEERFPYVCPACVHCLAQWAEKHNQPLQPIARENARSELTAALGQMKISTKVITGLLLIASVVAVAAMIHGAGKFEWSRFHPWVIGPYIILALIFCLPPSQSHARSVAGCVSAAVVWAG